MQQAQATDGPEALRRSNYHYDSDPPALLLYHPSMFASRAQEDATALQLDFLRRAAQHLRATDAATSAHLLLRHTQLQLGRGKPVPAAQHRDFCAACGCWRTPGAERAYVETPSERRRKAGKTGQPGRTGTVLTCGRCRRDKVLLSKRAAAAVAPPSEADTDTPPPPPAPAGKQATGNTTSKKRAKARKQAGLLATLQARKAQQQSAPASLDILDFLQQR
ncbi:hypothetical protein KEM52_003399 [Ascosphaera acerosa]|nr:hypothetical protein KEM52_003399 [Ascosphaera acerosa]